MIHKRRSSCKDKGATFLPGVRQEAIAAATRSSARKMRNNDGETGKEAIHQILTDHSQGLSNKDIAAKLADMGFRKLNAKYVSGVVSGDPRFVRVKRGFYRIKRKLKPLALDSRQQRGTTIVRNAQDVWRAEHEEGLTHVPREALLLRIETLEAQNKALQDAHITLIRGAFA